MPITEANPATIANLWQRLRSMMTRASVLVGALPALAALASLTRRRQREIACCITRLEAIARKLIFVAAAELHRAERDGAKASRMPRLEIVAPPASWSAGLRPASAAEAKSQCAPGGARSNLPAFDPTQPETWRVRFSLAPPRDEAAVPESRAPRIRALWGPTPALPPPASSQPRDIAPAPRRLALRFEALRRVIADPAPYARRLARLLPRLCRRFPSAAGRYAIAIGRPYAGDEGDPRLMLEAIALALAAAALFVNSS
ncbi:MAG: hypothetical protein AB7G40_17930 [Hyphomonadaceae bacterium]